MCRYGNGCDPTALASIGLCRQIEHPEPLGSHWHAPRRRVAVLRLTLGGTECYKRQHCRDRLRACVVRAVPDQADFGSRRTSTVIKLRLRRMGAKKRPSYRIVAADSRSPRDGRIIESLGFYDPVTDPATINVNLDRARHWIDNGAQPTDTVRSILKRAGVYAEAAE